MTDWHGKYEAYYKKLKEQGKSFFPYTVLKDTVAALIVFGVLLFLAQHFGAELEDLADPTDTTYNPRPEWYFLFLFQALKAFPGNMEAVGALLLPGLGVGLLAAVPFLDRGPQRHPLRRPFWTALGIAALSGWSYLTYAGFTSPLTNPSVEKDPQVLAGRRLFNELKCEYCHTIGGKGGRVGPALDKAVGNATPEWLTKHFRDPQALSPGSIMPKMNLLDDEITSLVAYMKSLEGTISYTPEAKKLFADNCAACHKIGKEGGDVGPDLSLIGSARDKNFIKHYVTDPTVSNPQATMPGFKGQLTDVQIEDIARYLSSLGKQ